MGDRQSCAPDRQGEGPQWHRALGEARNLLRAFYPAMRKAGITRFRFHDLRHTFATRLIQAGVDVYTVQKLGRWKTISMVLRYAHHQPESLRGGAEVLDRLRRESGTKLAQLSATSTGVLRNPLKKWWRCPGLNGGPEAYESAAKPLQTVSPRHNK
jgi:hypothetical protein